MILSFADWRLSPNSGTLGYQFDNLTRELVVQGDLPEGWEWDVLVSAGGNGDTWHLTPGDGKASIALTEDNLSVSGEYYLQLRGIKGEQVRHTNIVTAKNFRSLSGAGQWPTLPTEWIQAEKDIKELNAHPPVPGEDGYWQLWDLTTHSYQPSQLVVPGLSIQAGTVTTLEPDQPATVKVVGDGPDYQVNFGIPQGKPGKDGAPGKDGTPGKNGTDGAPGKDGQTPNITVGEVEKLEPDQDPTAFITGETPNLVLNLGVPQGQPGQDGVQINDDAVNTTEAWSSKKIVDTLCPPFTETGNPITCNPVEDYPLGVTVTTEPIQEGEGDPSPENVRPISGRNSVKVTVSNEDESHDYTLTLPETIYGGTVDAVSGEGSNQYIFRELAIADMNNGESFPGWTNLDWINDCKHNPAPDGNFVSLGIYGVTSIADISQGAFWNSNGTQIYSTSDQWGGKTQSQIKEAYPDLVVQFCLQLVTPTPFQATGNQPIPALAGENTVYTDAGSLTVSGRVNPLTTIQTMQAQITALQDQVTQGGTT